MIKKQKTLSGDRQAMPSGRQGFSLMELLIAIAIIGVLTTLGYAAMTVARSKANIAHAEHELSELHKSFEILANETGEWPGHQAVNVINESTNNELCEVGCTYKLSSPEAGLLATDGAYSNWSGPYLKKIFLDPWNNEYFFDTDYIYEGDVVAVVGSYGPDGITGPSNSQDDIIKKLLLK